MLALPVVVLTVALVPNLGVFGGDGDGVRTTQTTSSMGSVWIDVHNTDTARRRFTVVAIGPTDETPVGGVRLLPEGQQEVAAGESKRVLVVFQNLRPGELREARICYAAVNLPMDRTCESFAIQRL